MGPSLQRWRGLARKARGRPLSLVARRGWQELTRQARRPWYRWRPALLTSRALLAKTGAASIDAMWRQASLDNPLLDVRHRGAWAEAFRQKFPNRVPVLLDEAERRLRHEFDLLGSGPCQLGNALPWHQDFKVGRTWPLAYAHSLPYDELELSSDVKVPWELSRCQHLPRLGQAWWLTRDDRFADEFVSLGSDWIRANPWGYGVNWLCTMDVALRAVSWIWALGFFADAAACRSDSCRKDILASLWLHGEFIAANLEISDVNGNHYLADGIGLIALGALFRHSAIARRWLDRGQQILEDALNRQVHEDGVDFEQAIAYHRLVLEACLTGLIMLRRAGRDLPGPAIARLGRMCDYVVAYTRPDGLAPLIGDADDGRIQALGTQPPGDHRYLLAIGAAVLSRPDLAAVDGGWKDEAYWWFGPEGDGVEGNEVESLQRSTAFPTGGVFVMRRGTTHLIADAAEVGLAGRGGHGHNDVLSFELVLGGMPLVTDCGAFVYTASPEWRNRFRGTASHNTVQVDAEELNRFGDPKDLWALRYDAVPEAIVWRPGASADYLAASHRGYLRLPDAVGHRREFVVGDHALVLARDRLTGAAVHDVAWRIHLPPGVVVELDGRSACVSASSGDRAWVCVLDAPSSLQLVVDEGWVSPSYGVKVAAPVLRLSGQCELPATITAMFARQPPETIDLLPLMQELEAHP